MKGSSRLRYWELPLQNGIQFLTGQREGVTEGQMGKTRGEGGGIQEWTTLVQSGGLAARPDVSLK